MALGDRQVLASQVAAGNSDYVIPGAVSLQLKAVQALFTDNGAGGDWLPAVVAISDSGHVFWRAVDQGVKVTAGDDAEVSWFPGLKHAALTTAGTFRWCRVILGADIPSGSIDPGPGTTMTIADFTTNDAVNYQQIDATTWQIAQVATVLLLQLVPGPAGAPRVTNGDVVGLIRSAAGGGTLAFAGNGVKVFAVTGGKVLTNSFEWTNAFRGELRGTETGSWFVNAYFGTVF